MRIRKFVILVVDPDIQMRKLVSLTLASQDYEVMTASSEEEALRILQESLRVDLIISEIDLSLGSDGFSLSKHIRENFNIPIMILSVRRNELDIVKALDLGADDYLVKPFGIP